MFLSGFALIKKVDISLGQLSKLCENASYREHVFMFLIRRFYCISKPNQATPNMKKTRIIRITVKCVYINSLCHFATTCCNYILYVFPLKMYITQTLDNEDY